MIGLPNRVRLNDSTDVEWCRTNGGSALALCVFQGCKMRYKSELAVRTRKINQDDLAQYTMNIVDRELLASACGVVAAGQDPHQLPLPPPCRSPVDALMEPLLS